MGELPESEEAILRTALGLPLKLRDERLRKACGENLELFQRLKLRLDSVADSSADAVNEPEKVTVSELKVPSEQVGDKIGHYKLLQRLGEGGCGIVYLAQQEEPIRRQVAFKVIKVGLDTRQGVARFEAERQALALMDHPNISKVLDAGSTQAGRPFFVMELVRGIKITDYCDQNKLSLPERLNLFTQVCHAIQHAHQKGIITGTSNHLTFSRRCRTTR
jgi:serine/threonine protein kinase